jgi:hypothetical protein
MMMDDEYCHIVEARNMWIMLEMQNRKNIFRAYDNLVVNTNTCKIK